MISPAGKGNEDADQRASEDVAAQREKARLWQQFRDLLTGEARSDSCIADEVTISGHQRTRSQAREKKALPIVSHGPSGQRRETSWTAVVEKSAVHRNTIES